MKMDRNMSLYGTGKYALINLRKIPNRLQSDDPDILSVGVVRNPEAIEMGLVGAKDEFFVIKLKDKYARAAMLAYASAAQADDPEWAGEVRDLADRASEYSRFCKAPD